MKQRHSSTDSFKAGANRRCSSDPPARLPSSPRVAYLFLDRPMTRLLSRVCATAVLFSGCTPSGTYYEADASGRFRKIPNVLSGYGAASATYVIDGKAFYYDFRALGSAEVRDVGPTHLPPGHYKRTLHQLQEAPIFSNGRALFGGIIRRLHDANLTTDRLKSIRDRGRETEDIKADNRPAAVQYRQVNGRRWFVRTEFRDKERRSVTSRTYHTITSGLLITLYVDLDTSFTLKLEWEQRCLDALDQLVSGFRYLGPKTNETAVNSRALRANYEGRIMKDDVKQSSAPAVAHLFRFYRRGLR
jgi:hypothetical protein